MDLGQDPGAPEELTQGSTMQGDARGCSPGPHAVAARTPALLGGGVVHFTTGVL